MYPATKNPRTLFLSHVRMHRFVAEQAEALTQHPSLLSRTAGLAEQTLTIPSIEMPLPFLPLECFYYSFIRVPLTFDYTIITVVRARVYCVYGRANNHCCLKFISMSRSAAAGYF